MMKMQMTMNTRAGIVTMVRKNYSTTATIMMKVLKVGFRRPSTLTPFLGAEDPNLISFKPNPTSSWQLWFRVYG